LDSDKRDLIDNEILRLRIKHHPNFSIWYDSLPPHAKQVFDRLIDEDVTPELIELSQAAPEHEWDNVEFLRVIGGGNADLSVALALTNFTLGDILCDIENQG
jgi:hypothetical protein